LWFLEQLAPGSTAYHMPFALRLSGDLDVEALRKAFDALSHRHESLRTTMEIVEGRARQKIHPSGRFDLSFDDLSSHDSPESAAYRAGAEEALRPFDLAAGPLFRVRLFRLLEKEHILLVVMHHIISDGWSMGVMMRELLAHYEAAHAGRAAIFPELSVQYADYAVWQRSWLSGDVLERQLAYWRDRLSGVAPLELPTDRPRPPLPSHRGASVKVSLGTELTEALHALARRRGATLFMVLLAGFQALLYRMSGQTDIAVGTPIAGRTQKELEGLIGFFVNTLVLRTDFAPNPRFLDLLGQVKEATLDAYAHQDIPFEKLVEELAPTRDLSRQPLFQVMFALQNTPVGDLNMAGLGVAPLDLEGTETAKFDLTLNITEQRGALEGVLEYATDLFDAKTVERMVERLRLVLDAAVRSPEARVSDWHILTEQETRLLAQWNQTETAYPREACIHELFEAQVDRTPDAVALVFEDERVTYAELERHANRLGRILRQHGVVAETRVALCLERKTDLIAALLGILKSGGAYVPLDPAYPAERLSYMLSDSGASLLLTSRNLAGAISGPSAHTLFLDEIVPGDDSDGDERMRADVHAENLAYLIYTSGSTGRPKGVSLTHRSAARFLRWAHEVFSSSEMSGVLAATSICFDLSIFEIFGPLTMGGTVVLARDVLSLPSLPGRDRVTLVNTVPSAIAELLRTHGLPDSVKTVNLAGEPLPLSIAQRIHALPFVEKLYNLYGPTEDTTYSTFTRVERGTNTAPTIGRPVQGTRGYVLDRHMQLVPVGVRGEFYLAGAGLARGYLDRPGLSAERFLPDPFGPEAGARMYRTGDLARWLPDGTLEYFGRADTQIKLRGFRIELGEIEAALSVHPGVRDAVVALRQDRLVAYIVAEPEPTPASLREHLGRKLPEYMIPAAFVTLAALPLSPNGKIDRRALPDPSREHVAVSEKDVAPRTPAEQALADLFAEVLRLPRVGVHDDFFGLGGHSLLATQLVSRVRSSLEIELPLRALFESPTVSGLAARVEVERRKGGAILPPVQRHGRDDELPLSFAQQRLWFLDQLAPGSTAYHMPFALRLSGPLDVEALRGAFEAISRRHEVLRTNIETFEGRARQKIHRPERFDLPLDDLSRHDAPGSQAYRLGAEEALRPFDLATGPLFRARLFRLRDQEHILVAVMHHIISDGWSMAIVMRELLAHYDAVRTGRVAILPELPVQYADYAVWQRKWLSGDVLQRQLAYWREKLSGVAPLELPADRPRPPQPSHRGGSVRISLTKGLTEALHALARRRGGTLFMVLLAGFQTLLHRMSDQTDIAVGTPIAGRTQKELEGLIGFFVNTLVLRTNFAQDPSFLELLEQVKETTLDAYAHQDIPFEKLVEEISPTRDLSRQPLFQVMFALQNTPLEASEPGGLAVARLDLEGAEAAKFDLTLNLTESEGALVGALVYASDLFDVETVQRMVERLGAMLEEAVRSPDAPVSDWPLLTAEESRLLTQWNATEAPYPQAACIHELFEAQVDRTPDALAVVFEDEAVTYDELDRRANGYASLLRAQGVGPEARVGLCLPRSVELIVAILGVLKAGGAYVPLDPSYPRERLEYMLQDSGARLLVTRGEPGESIAVHGHDLLDFSQLDAASDARLQSGVRPDNLAYIIYTSGSTGKPKGVMVAHRGACNLAETQRRLFGLGEGHRVLQFSRTSFDASVFELLLALPVGGCLVLARAETLQPGDGLASLLEEREIDAALLPPSALAVMSEEKLSRPALLWVGGEACPPEVARRWSQGRRLINAYGPTEITVCATMFAYEPFEGSLPIGRALPNTHVYVLDRNLRLAPLGVPGELYIGGVGLARGYEGRHGLTAERFLPDPFSPVHGARMYRTGDRARWLQRGNLEFLGRVDEQVKLRGFRIELGEIEAALGAHPGVRDAAVNLRGDRLVGYVVADPELAPSPSALREHLGRVLPDYMIPAAFVTLDALPLSPSGKVDRRALPEPTNEIHPEEARRSRDRLEFELATIWEDLLGIRGVGLRDDFFALGGHSLLAARLAARIESQIGRKLPLARLLRGATVEEVAAALREDPAGPRSPLVALQPRGTRAPLYCVHAIGGSALSYLELARALGDEQPLHALHASGLDEGEPANDVVKMAKHYVDALLETNPKDAIRLLGWSFGGLVAFEMARELEARGVPVEEIILVDTHLPTRMQDPGDVSLALLFAREHGMTLSIEQETLLITASPEERGALLSALAVEQGIFPIGMAETILRRTLGVYEAHLHALQNYVARRATLRMSLIRATGFPAFAEEVASLKDPTGGWGELVVPAPMVCDLPGDHFSLLRAPLVAEVARIVQGCSPRSSRGEYTHDV
jgi:amino acid adenylation domain-containing protein